MATPTSKSESGMGELSTKESQRDNARRRGGRTARTGEAVWHGPTGRAGGAGDDAGARLRAEEIAEFCPTRSKDPPLTLRRIMLASNAV